MHFGKQMMGGASEDKSRAGRLAALEEIIDLMDGKDVEDGMPKEVIIVKASKDEDIEPVDDAGDEGGIGGLSPEELEIIKSKLSELSR